MASTALVVQYVIVVLAVVVSACVVVHKQSPALSRRVRMRIAIPLVRASRPSWLAKLGRWIAPSVVEGASCDGCNNGCGPTR